MECTVYLQCRLLEAIVISDRDLACSEVLIVFTCSCDCTFYTCDFFSGFGVYGRTEQIFKSYFLPSFRKCYVLSNFATSEMKNTLVCI